MVTDFFDSFLEELGQAMDIDDLHHDDNNTCLIKFQTGLEVQIEPFEKGDFLLICSDLGHVAPGRYREDVFREALKANGLPYPQYGTFAYSEQSDHLLLFGLLSFKELNGEKIASFLYPFMEKAVAWKEQINGGEVPLATTSTAGAATTSLGGLFGLKP
ncbi:MAG: CesT family type III secretion system chaperone [Waddliaceae bacterium]